ncbi:MAG: hypothetical protein BGO09_01435 [Bacteroidetes bacterium 47-18]|nr:MAG: hypothetical protein BGO09_01435 [Bacteroidetes bacterium 47-18]
MKKVILPLLVASLAIVSCGNNETSETVKVEQTTTPEETTETKVTVTSEVPNFSTPEAQQFAKEYTAFVDEMIAASKAGDAAKVQELTGRMQEWSTKATEVAAKMTAEDAKLWAEYASKLQERLLAK